MYFKFENPSNSHVFCQEMMQDIARTGQQTLASWSQITKFSPNFILVHLSLIAEQCQPRIIKQQLNSSSAEHVMSQHIVMLTRSDGVRGGVTFLNFHKTRRKAWKFAS
jgi:hypothetical protein